MEPLHLDVEQGFGIDHNSSGRADYGGEFALVGLFDGVKLLLKRGIAGVSFEIADLRKIADQLSPISA